LKHTVNFAVPHTHLKPKELAFKLSAYKSYGHQRFYRSWSQSTHQRQ